MLGQVVGATVLGRPHVRLSEIGKAVDDAFIYYNKNHPSIKIDHYVIMSNHIHAIIALVGAPLAAPARGETALSRETGRASASLTIGNIVRGYKAGVSRSVGFAI
jgi:hypothetical protein